MQDYLPYFPYHLDPVATGSFERTKLSCECCQRSRGYRYIGPCYSASYEEEIICPWCIADGTAHVKYDLSFTEIDGKVSPEIRSIVEHRTPGFAGWQQERWLTHCQDAAIFLGRAGYQHLKLFPGTFKDIYEEHQKYGWSGYDIGQYIEALDADGMPTAYLFRCRHCDKHLVYTDET